MSELFFVMAAGFVLGLLHSMDPDHLAAMSTLIGRVRGTRAADFIKGLHWGIGHTLVLALFGTVLVATGSGLSGYTERLFEAGVGVLLVYLGLRRLRDARRGPHQHAHRHGDIEHVHFHIHPPHEAHGLPQAHAGHSHAPLWIGILHGLAGTGGVMVLLPAVVIENLAMYLTYVAAFGIGSVVSMGAFCAGAGRFAGVLQDRHRNAGRWLAAAAGSLSLAVGLFWIANSATPFLA